MSAICVIAILTAVAIGIKIKKKVDVNLGKNKTCQMNEDFFVGTWYSRVNEESSSISFSGEELVVNEDGTCLINGKEYYFRGSDICEDMLYIYEDQSKAKEDAKSLEYLLSATEWPQYEKLDLVPKENIWEEDDGYGFLVDDLVTQYYRKKTR